MARTRRFRLTRSSDATGHPPAGKCHGHVLGACRHSSGGAKRHVAQGFHRVPLSEVEQKIRPTCRRLHSINRPGATPIRRTNLPHLGQELVQLSSGAYCHRRRLYSSAPGGTARLTRIESSFQVDSLKFSLTLWSVMSAFRRPNLGVLVQILLSVCFLSGE